MKVSAFMVATLLAVLGCKKSGEHAAEGAHQASEKRDEHLDEKDHGELPKQLRVSPQILQEADVKSEVAKRAVLATTVSLPGEITAEPDRTARLSAATGGKLEKVTFNEGSVVKKGEVLAVLRVPDVGRLRGALAGTLAKAKAAQANAARLRSLKESGLGAEQAVVDAEADAKAQEAEAKALNAQLGAIGANAEPGGGFLVSLRSPISGVVTTRNAVVGQPIGAEEVLATIVDLSEVWFLGRVFEKDLGRLRIGAKCEVQLNAFPDTPFEGTVEYVGQQTDPVARTLTARIKLQNDGGRLRLGLFGTAHVNVEESHKAGPEVTVPRNAVTDVGDKNIVFVKAKDGDFVVHEVTLGKSALSQTQVLSGLDEGEEVVTQGVFTLKSLLLKSTLSEDEH